jgi:hypothetical protein
MLQPLLYAALSYAARGWMVIPLHWPLGGGRCSCADAACASPGKHPIFGRWEWHASNEPHTLRSWWAQAPRANVGVATGASGLVVLDVDGPEGIASLKALAAENRPLPRTLKFRTGSGGLHLIFKDPSFSVPSRRSLRPKLDVRGDGGLICAPPSLHASGRRYEEIGGALEPAEIPRWLSILIRRSPRSPARAKPRPEAVKIRAEERPAGSRRYVGLGDPGRLALAIRERLTRGR